MVFGSLLTEIWTKVLWDLGNIVSLISQPIMNQTTCIVACWNQEVEGFKTHYPNKYYCAVFGFLKKDIRASTECCAIKSSNIITQWCVLKPLNFSFQQAIIHVFWFITDTDMDETIFSRSHNSFVHISVNNEPKTMYSSSLGSES